MEYSIFMDKNTIPDPKDLRKSLGKTFCFWEELRVYVHEKYPGAVDEWNFPGVKYGWGFRVKDKKRAIIYFGPRGGYFMVSFVFGQKATEVIMKSTITESLKKELEEAKVYAEGKPLRIEVSGKAFLKDIKFLIDIKISN